MKTRALVLVVVLLAGCVGVTTQSTAPIDQAAPGAWTPRAALPTARQEVAVAARAGEVWVIGGFDRTADPTATVETYDPATNTWRARTPLPVPLHHAAAAVVGDRLLVIGGYTGGRVRWTPMASVWEWIEASATWQERAPMPTARGALAVAVLGGRLHALGGAAGDPLPTHEVYDPGVDRWVSARAMPTPRDHLAAVAFEGRVWAIGGRSSFFGDQYSTVETFEPAMGDWQIAASLPAGRGGIAAVALADRILVFGGEAPFRIFDAVEMYEPAGRRWIAKEPMPTARHGIGAAVVRGRVHVPGGAREPGFAASDAHEVYTP